MTLEEYLNLITSEYRQQPNYIAMVSEDLAVPIEVQTLMKEMIPDFDVDVAVGDQLDIIGEWVGITRNVTVPIAGIFFSWDDPDPLLGWDYGIWAGATTITVLPDEQYRILIKAKIAANQWDGTTDGAYAIWDAVFTEFTILIQDNQDMSYDLIVVGGIPDALTQSLIRGGYIPLKPEGVRVNEYVFPVDDGPLFGWDVENEFVKGWDEGSWGIELSPL